MHEPDGGALLRGLAEEEPDLLEGFGEGVSGGHCGDLRLLLVVEKLGGRVAGVIELCAGLNGSGGGGKLVIGLCCS